MTKRESPVLRRTRWVLASLICTLGVLLCAAAQAAMPALRPPSVPLVACDPYFSIWSPADKLTEADTVHWTGKPHRLTSLVRIDGKPMRLMGTQPVDFSALPQTQVEVLPTRTIYTFEGQGVRLTMTFMTAALPEDLMVYSRPVTYVTWSVEAMDGKEHTVGLYLDASGEIAVNAGQQVVTPGRTELGHLTAVRLGSKEQPVLGKRGDDLRIDWGYLYVAAPSADLYSAMTASTNSGVRDNFGQEHVARMLVPTEASGNSLLATVDFKPFKVSAKPVSRWLMLAYDDEYSIQYFKKNLRPYWRRKGDDAAALLRKAAADYKSLQKRCEKFDADLMAALTKAGGEQYAAICALAYRQCCAANKVVADDNGQPLMFPKENFSNGCIGTVDVIYPMAPQFLLFSPSLTKAMLVPIMDYAASPRWRFPFAPHDLGTYPLANGQVYGGGERTEQNQMPVEETGNMLVLLAALAQEEGNAEFCNPYWPVLERWAEFLKAKGFDPENQLCTDDFAGHLAHNVNLSAKAICGLGAYARLCEMRGQKAQAADTMKLAQEFAARWVKEAEEGEHSRLAFDKPETWSQKYNLVWDRILGLNLFPAEVLRKEMTFYKTKQNTYGLPLDVRKDYTKLDWTLWTATLTQDPADFEALVGPVFRFLNESPSRVPMTDWFDTKTGEKRGFQARSVVGGVFLEMLYDKAGWKKWAGCDTTKASHWAPLPKAPKLVVVVPTSEEAAQPWRYTTEAPAEGWAKADFDAATWKEGPGGFGNRRPPGAPVHTEWNTSDIWLRREFVMPAGKWSDLQLCIRHADDAEVYIDGEPATHVGGNIRSYDTVRLSEQARKLLTPGQHVLAAHCKKLSRAQYIDVGLVDVQAAK